MIGRLRVLLASVAVFAVSEACAQIVIPVGGGTGGSGTPGGSNTQCQYNNSGSFGGITGCTSNGTAVTLVAPVLGTPASGVATNITGLPLTTGVTGTLPIANGGTNSTATATAGGAGYGTGTAHAYTAAGTTGQVLTSQGASAPIWSAAGSGTVTSVATGACLTGGTITTTGTVSGTYVLNAQTGTTYTIVSGDACKLVTFSNASAIAVTLPQATGSFAAGFSFDTQNLGAGLVTITPTTSTINGATSIALAQNQGCTLVSDGTNWQVSACTALGGSGVTSAAASFTGGLISISGSPITSTGTFAFTVAGTSGGVPYFNSNSGWASSAALAANALVIGGGAGAAPATTNTGTGVLTAIGNNLSAAGGLTTTVASGTSAMGTSAISSGTCATVVTTSATNTATTDVIQAGFNGDPTGVTGYAPATTGMLTIISYPSVNNVNFKVCNNTSASITPGAITLNWRVAR